jgi:hypothetical protein
MYKLVFDQNGKKEMGTWYGNELALVTPDVTEGLSYKATVERSRIRNGIREEYTNYNYWPAKYSQWEAADRITDFRR